jgi:hypothetical protein
MSIRQEQANFPDGKVIEPGKRLPDEVVDKSMQANLPITETFFCGRAPVKEI